MYRILFREIVAYQDQADQLAAESKPDSFLRDYHQTVLELTPQLAAQLIQIARECVSQIQAIDKQAAAVIQAVKAQYKGAARSSPNAMVPAPPAELADLEAKRSAAVLEAANAIAAAFGPAQFAYFDNLVRLHVGSGFRVAAHH